LKLSSSVYGIWTGATTLDLPQLVAAALQGGGNVSLQAGLLVKSIRIGLLAPVILMLVAISTSNKTSKLSTVEYKETDFRPKSSYRIRSRYKNRSRSNYRMALSSFPLFILVFFLVILLNTVVQLPSGIIAPLASGTGEFLRLNLANLMLTAAIIGICFRVSR